MEFLTMFQLEMLNFLMRYEVVEMDALTSYLNCSLRKCQLEIKQINQIFKKHDIAMHVRSLRGRGYALQSDGVADQYRIHINRILEQSLLRQVHRNDRTAMIARDLLLAQTAIKAEHLADKYIISLGTLTSDLREVRSLFEAYDLVIKSTPYYGLSLKGNLMNQLSALLDLVDWYGVGTVSCFSQGGLAQLGLSEEVLKQTEKTLMRCLEKHHYVLTETGFRRVVLLLNVLGLPKFEDLVLTAISHIDQFKETRIARELLGDQANEHHWLCLTYYLIANIDANSKVSARTHYQLYNGSKRLYAQLVQSIKQAANLDLLDAAHPYEGFIVFLMKFVLRKNVNIKEFNTMTSLVDFVKALPATQSLTAHIMHLLRPDHGVEMNDMLYYELAILIYNYAYSNGSEYEPMRVLVMNDFNLYANESIVRHMNMDRFGISFEYAPTYVLPQIDQSRYDCIVSTSRMQSFSEVTIPVFTIDYLSNKGQSEDFWGKFLMRKRKSNHVLNQLRVQRQFDVVETDVTIAARIIQTLHEHHIVIPNGFHLLQMMMSNQRGWTKRDTLTLCLLWAGESEVNIFSFHCKQGISMNDRTVHIVRVIVLNPQGRMISIKQADSSIRRLDTV